MQVQLLMAALAIAVFSPDATANATKVGLILEQQREIRDEMETTNGKYARFRPAARERISSEQQQVLQLLEGVNAVEQLDKQRQIELFNALENIKAVISRNEDDRQECWRERKLGTTLKVTRCATVAERSQISKGAQDWKGRGNICGGGISCGEGKGDL